MPRLFDDSDLLTLLAGAGAETSALVNGGTLTVALFERGTIQLTADGPLEIEQPYLLARTVDLAGLDLEIIAGPQGDPLTIDGVEYIVLSVSPDRAGISTVTLQEVE